MDELIIRVLEGAATSEEAAGVARWKEESSANRERFEAVRLVWHATVPPPLPAAVDSSVVSRIVDKAREREPLAPADAESEQRVVGIRPPWARPLRWVLPLAAAVAAVALGVRLWPAATMAVPIAVFTTTVPQGETFTLDDGTFVRLSSSSRLEEFQDPTARRYTLHGRAFFAVAHDASRPFVVTAGDAEIRVLGTRFEVMESESGIRTLVLEGSVAVSDDAGSESVTAGEVALVSGNGPPRVARPQDIYTLLDWPGGILLFQDTPLSDVVREVQRHFGKPVALGRSDLGELRISASYGSEAFEEIVASLCAVTGRTCTLTDSLAVIH